jgi:tetratricopeptide (TPR) repeat protein
MTDRDAFIKIIHTALSAGRADYARYTANDWLTVWPGDATILTYLARAEMELGFIDSAMERVDQAIHIDPEQIDAYQIKASALRAKGQVQEAQIYQACAQILKKDPLDQDNSPAWALHLEEAMAHVRRGEFESAVAKASISLTADPQLVLPTYSLMSIQRAADQDDAAQAVAQNGHQRWPNCVAFLLLLGQAEIERGDHQAGIDLLHRAAMNDPNGHVTKRFLGDKHAYIDLWPVNLEAELSRPIPAEVANDLGDNQLSVPVQEKQPVPNLKPVGCDCESQFVPDAVIEEIPAPKPQAKVQEEALPKPEPWEAFKGPNTSEHLSTSTSVHVPEALHEIDKEFRRLADRLNARKRARDEDGRSPAYIVLSSRSHLMQSFEEEGFKSIDEGVLRLVESVRRRYGWTAYRIYIDDPRTLEPFGLSPVDPGNAWQIKLRIADLDHALGRRGEMIGALLIVGGNGIIPFHLLPNPTDDDDEVIPSDNPYATSDENYFIPEWPVGRLPGEDEPELIINQLNYALKNHNTQAAPPRSIWRLFRQVGFGFMRILTPKAKTLGYSASIWRKSSFAVFKTIGDPNNLITSPPIEADKLPSQAMRPTRLSYFNLHGIEDAPEWYGQRDPMRDRSTPVEFPIALRPSDVINSGRAPRVVFTEACYGANSIGKTSESALSLKFLSSGSRAVIGSTKISYGSVRPPLIAADLLGQLFWQFLNKRLPVGEALRRAKMKLAAEMHQRQGYLDGEDQKTLISFVLYGDPLYQPSPSTPQPGEKTVIRRIKRPSTVNTACALGGEAISEDDLSPATMKRIEHIVSQYLPGMQEAVCTIHNQHIRCQGGDHICPSQHFEQKSVKQSPSGAMVITLSKHIADGQRRHPHFARLTLDSQGKVMKLAVSR